MMLILLVFACARSGDTSPIDNRPESPTESIVSPEHVSKPAPPEMPALETHDDEKEFCMASCLEKNQARATAIEIIEADCQASCIGTQVPLATQPLEPPPSPLKNP